ncbi:hypothetical protein A3B21_00305 [Candidatus Uhrbacteria bacterium RIFCSPLOWO2_01_FULL_47_24]|uniref:DUF218 domain-containing protein n=1 Tax=Candidatus Uhrbacteria bacterium RIFCSPLOWO2_01_FULL_47_24 TaxID=1802401 RepID=A0A1F7USR6_9BACT|nr:MAG: hypothetical protein A2753_03935 [Candidatus Uhrbacteria bacterium RIFCSPHIGHO2_01_FULL_47_11]OGL67783.1 MAG: hypothetical protein A3D58_00015 [Candidatus Uhrbacteria bacterium RIFCSPHIGHO2_02_FULL_46_47]OGL76319.1 MAG: hypothetical protein A3F52_01005 [Candidatus Uhrbacteria bacterium RIFCSPHIGHO2_12_FULL_47_11]OGL81353.1 MAG: hypothetical protein A3B21_00305 [Candidatus Uhrbacteria bacterium RIFCSPLOWO2_01_FULL_47_24]OGL83787.1 MAG: hypothetical protein A3J03_02665 [Candidatus Uhrbact
MITPLIAENEKRLEPGLESINDTWKDLVDLVEWIMKEKPFPPKQDRQWSQVIIWGETDGLLGLENVKKLLSRYDNATLLISGGVYGREGVIDDIGAIDLYKGLEQELLSMGWKDDDIKRRVLIDSLSLHTGHQGLILSHVLKALSPEEVFVVEPLYHLPRFLLMLGYAMKELGLRANLIPVAYGNWGSLHPAKASKENPERKFKYEELFAFPPMRSLFEDKFDCGEVDKIIQRVKAPNKNCLSFKEFANWLNIKS